MNKQHIDTVKSYLLSLQDNICEALASEDGKAKFLEDTWQQNEIGGGKTRIITNGGFIEKGGVNFSHVTGKALPVAITALEPELVGCPFQAMGVSVVIHPLNPYVPTTHMNVRFFVAEKANSELVWWFGGGFDLTPYYGFIEDCQHWHQISRNACANFGDDVYLKYKNACDQYFFIKHRNETRGIGGLFFDQLSHWGFNKSFEFMKSVGDHFLLAYLPIVQRRKGMSYTEKERDFQLYRRGRYVEYNLIYDRGTLFGLQFGGRIESILMSLPPQVTWKYNWQPEKNSAEEKLYDLFLKPQDWINFHE